MHIEIQSLVVGFLGGTGGGCADHVVVLGAGEARLAGAEVVGVADELGVVGPHVEAHRQDLPTGRPAGRARAGRRMGAVRCAWEDDRFRPSLSRGEEACGSLDSRANSVGAGEDVRVTERGAGGDRS